MTPEQLSRWCDYQWQLFLEEPVNGTQRRSRGRKAARLSRSSRGLSRFRRLLE